MRYSLKAVTKMTHIHDGRGLKPGPQDARRGTAVMEFALVMPIMLIVSFLALGGGLMVTRYLSVIQLARNAGNMLSRDTDFAVVQNKQLLLMAANNLNMSVSGGQGVAYLSTVVKAPSGTANAGQLVVAQRFVIGNESLASSRVGTPSSAIWPDPANSQSNGDVADYDDEASAVAALPNPLGSLPEGETVFVAEVFYVPNDMNFLSAWGLVPSRLASTTYF